MIARLLLITITILFSLRVQAQDIPIFTQKLTNSFFYNPAVAGHTHGSMTVSHRQTFDNLITNNFISFHTPIANYKAGIGATVFTDKFSIIQRTYASVAAAYHINFASYKNLSFGLSADYITSNFDFDAINFDAGPQDPVFAQFQADNGFDVSFGMHYQDRYFKVGVAANRMIQNWFTNEENLLFDGFYTFMAAGLIPLRNRLDILEPRLTYVQTTNTSLWNAGLYYTFNNQFLGGFGYRQNQIMSFSAAVKVAKQIMLGYTYEISNGDINLGSTNEITLRFDFKDINYQQRFSADYREAVAYRRKSLSSSRTRKIGPASPAKARKKRIKNIKNFKSPNARFTGTSRNKSFKHRTKLPAKYKRNLKRQKKNRKRRNKGNRRRR